VNAWLELGIEPTPDLRAIKRAYAARLKQVDPERDIEGFQRLRAAYEAVRSSAKRTVQPSPSAPTSIPASVARDLQITVSATDDKPVPLSPLAVGADLATRFIATADAPAEVINARLRQLLQSPLLHSLMVREHFEQQLLHQMLAAAELPLPLSEICVLVLEWNDRRHPLWRDRLPALVGRLAAIKSQQRARDTRRRLADIRGGSQGTPEDRIALLALLGPVRPLYYRWLAMFAGNRQAIVRRLEELTRLGPQVLAQETQAEAVAWWRKYLTRPQLRRPHWLMLLAAALLVAVFTSALLASDAAAPLAPFLNAHPLTSLAIAVGSWSLAAVLLAQLTIELHYHWRQAFGAVIDRQLARLRYTGGGRTLLLLAFCGLLLIASLPTFWWLRVVATVWALTALIIAFGRLVLRLALPASLWGRVGLQLPGLMTPGAWLPDAYGAIAAASLIALLAYCAAAFTLHDRLVRRGWPIERITRAMRGLVVVYWLLPLLLVGVTAARLSAHR
jgi:hypothetical protein